MIYADPTNDFAFKKIFGSQEHPEILIAFLNAILELPAPIEHVELANPYQIPKIEELKATILDIRARDARGVEFIVEMQVEKEGAFAKRSLYYTAKSYVAQLRQGENYPALLENAPVLPEAFEAAAQIIWSPKEIELYEYRKMHDARRKDVVETARQEGESRGRAKGLAEGLEKGIEQGIEKGIEQGIEKGREAGLQEALQRLLAAGMDEASARRLMGL